jgi:photosystem II stability/assembly factor-like uncharacterized protein
MTKSFAHLLILILILFISSNSTAQWKKTSLYTPSNIGIYKIYSNNGTIFISTYNSGLYRSTDGGLTWIKADNGLQSSDGSIYIYCAVVSSDNYNFFCIANYEQVYLSTNAGTNWVKIADYNNIGDALDLRIDQTGNLIVCSSNGVFKTTDEGKSWIDLKFNKDVASISPRQIEIDKNNNIYTLGINNIGNYVDSLFKFDNSTNKWSSTKPLPSGAGINVFQINHFGTIILHDNADNIFRSTDNGNSWQYLSKVSIGAIGLNINDNIFAASYNSSEWDIIYSSDYGKTWETIYKNISSSNSVFVSQDGNIYANAYNGSIIISSDNGKTWNPFKFLYAPITSVYAGNNNKLFAGASDGLYFSTDKGDTWTKSNTSGINFIPSDPINSILGNINNHMILDCGAYSLDGGLTWLWYPFGGAYGVSISAATILSNNTMLVCLETISTDQTIGSIKRSTDDGNTWTNTNGFNGSNIKMYAVATNNNIYSLDSWSGRPGMGGYGTEIYKSTDNGANWTNVFSKGNSPYGNNPDESLVSIGCHPNDNVFASSNLGIYRSTDHGTNWLKIDSSAKHINMTNFVFDNVGNIIANNSKGIFKSVDNGITWNLIDSTLIPTSLTIDSDGYLFAATSNQGLFQYLQKTTSVKETISLLPQQFLLEQNYPNPFNPSTIISYQVPKASHVLLKIYDVLGREVSTLIDKEQVPGNYKIQFSGQLSSGVYFYRLTAGDFSQTKKMLMLK